MKFGCSLYLNRSTQLSPEKFIMKILLIYVLATHILSCWSSSGSDQNNAVVINAGEYTETWNQTTFNLTANAKKHIHPHPHTHTDRKKER